jgi:5'-3' exonuclease
MKQIIMGDKADNIQGLEGYGEVKTTKFLDGEPHILDDVRELFKEKGQLQDFKINLNLVSMVSIDRYNFNTGEVKVL